MITVAVLKNYFPTAKNPLCRPIVSFIKRGISPLIKAHFLGQLAHESDSFKTLQEYASGKAYEGRKDLGNTAPGDGVKYKGRGYIQLTGKANYIAAGKDLGLDLVERPEQILIPDIAFEVSLWFWNRHNLNALALKDDLVGITKIINGGTNGLPHRRQMVKIFKEILHVEL